jgi:hypothetical protein
MRTFDLCREIRSNCRDCRVHPKWRFSSLVPDAGLRPPNSISRTRGSLLDAKDTRGVEAGDEPLPREDGVERESPIHISKGGCYLRISDVRSDSDSLTREGGQRLHHSTEGRILPFDGHYALRLRLSHRRSQSQRREGEDSGDTETYRHSASPC